MILNVDYIKKIAKDIGVDPNNVYSSDGFDAIITLLKSSRDDSFPKIIIEEANSGFFSSIPGGMETSTISIWIMGRVAMNSANNITFANMKVILLDLLKILIRYCEELSININDIPYFKRMAAMNNVGYELMITINKNISLDYE